MKKSTIWFVIFFLILSSSLLSTTGVANVRACGRASVRERPEKVVLLSVDGARPDYLRKFMEEGALPNFSTLARKGVCAWYGETTTPTVTAAAHASISTGAYSGLTGITGNNVHLPGESLDEGHRAFPSTYLEAEPIWVTAEEHGLEVTVTSWPQVLPNKWGLTESTLINPYDAFISGASYTELYTTNQTYDGYPDLVSVVDFNSTGWVNTPLIPGDLATAKYMEDAKYGEGMWIFYPDYPHPNHLYPVVTDTNNDTVLDTVSFYYTKDGSDLAASLEEGEWSDTITMHLASWGNPYTMIFKLKALEIDNLNDYKIFRTQLRPKEMVVGTWDWFSMGVNSAVDKEDFWENVCLPTAMILGSDYWPLENGWYGPETWVEMMDYATQYWHLTTDYLMTNTDWDLFLTYNPVPDEGGHEFLGYIDKRHPFYSDSTYEYFLNIYKQAYMSADDTLGVILNNVDLENTAVIVVSDHGMTPIWRELYINHILEQAGLLVRESPTSWKVDFSKTKAYYFDYGHIFVNLEGRDPQGIVPPKQYRRVQCQIVKALKRAVDPDTGKRVISEVFIKESGRARWLGLFPDATGRVGDVWFYPRLGYHWNERIEVDLLNAGEISELMDNPYFTGYHGYSAKLPDLHSIFVAGGAGIRRTLLWRARSIDVAPTISNLLNIPSPANAQGKPIIQILDYPMRNWKRVRR